MLFPVKHLLFVTKIGHVSCKDRSVILQKSFTPKIKCYNAAVLFCLSQKQNLLWDDQLNSLQSKMVEPVSHYVQRFPEIKVYTVYYQDFVIVDK